MPNNEQSLLGVSRENYAVPKGQEHSVHYKIAKLDANGGFMEPVRLVKSGVKTFETVAKRNLELQGYTIEILYHPEKKYTNVRIVDKNAALEKEKAENAALKAKLAEAEKKSKDEAEKALAAKEAEIAELKAKLEAATSEPKKVGRPKKEE